MTYVLNSEEIRKFPTAPELEKKLLFSLKRKKKLIIKEKTALLRNDLESWKRRFFFFNLTFDERNSCHKCHNGAFNSQVELWQKNLEKIRRAQASFCTSCIRIFDEIVAFEFWSSFWPRGPLPTGSKGPPQRNYSSPCIIRAKYNTKEN